MLFAHIRTGEKGLNYQTAKEHCQNTAKYAGACLRRVELEQTGILLGLVHDCGKFKKEFQEYLMASDGVRGSVNHTAEGALRLAPHGTGGLKLLNDGLNASVCGLAPYGAGGLKYKIIYKHGCALRLAPHGAGGLKWEMHRLS